MKLDDKNKSLNIKDLSGKEWNELFQKQMDYESQVDQPWQDRYKELIDYYKKEFKSVHISKMSLERAEQIKRNLDFWRSDIIELEEIEFLKYLDSVLVSVNDRIDELEKRAKNKTNQPSITENNIALSLPENKFDDVDMKDVYNHFNNHLVKRKRMSEADLIKYLKDAFELQKQPVKRYKIEYRTKGKIRKVFYQYYKDIAGKPNGKQEEYLNLLKDYFIGFEKESKTNFSK